MQCREINSLIMKYLDGNINDLEMEQIRRHNEKCSSCAYEFEILRDAILSIEELPDLDVPDGFDIRVMERVKKEKVMYVNPSVLVLGFVSLIGLMMFSFNIIYQLFIPYLKGEGLLIIINNVIIYAIDWMINIFKDIFMNLTLLTGRILSLANIIWKYYTNLIIAVAILFMMLNVILVKTLTARE